MPKKATASTTSRAVEGIDGILSVDVFVPGHEPFRTQITIENLLGNTRPPQREPREFRKMLVEALESKFGKSIK